MTTALRSYDHYAPDIAATVLPGAPVPASPYWTTTVTRRSVTAGSRIRWADGTMAETELVRLDEQLPAYALLPGPTGTTHREISWLASAWLPSEWALTQVVAQGFGRIGIDELRRRLRRAGYAIAADELTIQDAIAGTQAAVWRVSTGRELDARHVNPVAVSHVYDYLLGCAGVPGDGRREITGSLGARYFVAGVSAVEIRGAEVVDPDGRSLAGIVVPGQRFHLKGAGRRITLRTMPYALVCSRVTTITSSRSPTRRRSWSTTSSRTDRARYGGVTAIVAREREGWAWTVRWTSRRSSPRLPTTSGSSSIA